MDRREYMQRLEQLLQDLPKEEREEALQYYNDYFEDAGKEKEAAIIKELGTPETAAEQIRGGCSGEYAEYSEQGVGDSRFQNTQEIMAEEAKSKKGGMFRSREGKNRDPWKIFAILLLVFLASPIILPAGMAVLAVVFSVIVALLALLFGVGVSGVAVLIAGIAVIFGGIVCAIGNPGTGILTAGIGCILLAVGILLSLGMFHLFIKIIPKGIRFIVNLLGTPFRKAGGR